jgi:hypothetical protein
MRHLHRFLRRSTIIVLTILAAVWLRGCVVRPARDHLGSFFNRRQNAAWLGIEWVNEPHSLDEIKLLANDLQDRQITYAYIYVSYLRANGEFGQTYSYAADFVATLRQANPTVKVLAWYGIPTKHVKLDNDQVHTTIAEFSKLMVESYGFDGVQIDAEPTANNDRAFLNVLLEIRRSMGQQPILSVATPVIWPVFPDSILSNGTGSILWSAGFYREVAQNVDQIAVMTYDSGLPIPVLYRLWSRFQIIGISKALAGSKVQLFMGVPTSEEETASHHAYAENMTSGLLGIIDGLNDSETHSDSVTGVAIYPYWETTTEEWSVYQSLWLGTQP